MTASNRVQVAIVREVTPGTTPNTPRMRTARITSEGLTFTPEYADPDEIRADRMMGDPIKQMQASQGPISFELSYPKNETFLSEVMRSAMFAAWSVVNERDNDGTANTVVDAVATSNEVLTVTTGTAFVAKELYKFSGFGVANNNGVFACTTASATVPRFVGAGLTDEASPPAAARVKCVGFIGDSGDINATATGISSTTTNFTTIPGIAVGKWLKIGGTGAGFRFVTAALNDWVRITAFDATSITFDNRPSGWTTETGTALTIKFWFGDSIRNGTTKTSLSIEKGFLGQTVPTYIVNTGMVVNTLEMSAASRAKITGSAAFMGMGGSQSTTPLDASPDAVTTGLVMAGNANVGRIGENGSQVTSPNWAKSINWTINNNLRVLDAADSTSPVGVEPGECQVSGSIETYFGDNTLLAKLYAGTASAINTRLTKDSQAVIWTFPRVTFRDGNPAAGGKNQDVMLPLSWQSSYDSVTGCHAQCDRLEYFE